MKKINTDIAVLSVEIDGDIYPVAAKTAAIAEALGKADALCAAENQPEYKLWLARLEVLLGKQAMRRLFVSGKAENIDRIERIYAGVIEAFEYNHKAMVEEQTVRNADLIAEALAPVNELLRRLNALDKDDGRKIIHRG